MSKQNVANSASPKQTPSQSQSGPTQKSGRISSFPPSQISQASNSASPKQTSKQSGPSRYIYSGSGGRGVPSIAKYPSGQTLHSSISELAICPELPPEQCKQSSKTAGPKHSPAQSISSFHSVGSQNSLSSS